MKKITALAFDLDHTLFDRYSTLRGLAYPLRTERRAWFPPELYAAKLGEILVETDRKWIYGGWELVYEKLTEQGLFSAPPGCEVFKQEMLRRFATLAAPILNVRPMLRDLRQRYAVGLITNGEAALQRRKLELLGLEDSFDAILISGEYGVAKPDPRIFWAMCEKLGCGPAEMLYVGDSPRMDVQGAYNAGLTPVWVNTGGHWPFPELKRAPYEVHDVTELLELLRTLEADTAEHIGSTTKGRKI